VKRKASKTKEERGHRHGPGWTLLQLNTVPKKSINGEEDLVTLNTLMKLVPGAGEINHISV